MVRIMKSRASRFIAFIIAVPTFLIQPTSAGSADAAAPTVREQVSPWRQTKTNEWVRYHYPLMRPAVFKDGRVVQVQAVVKGWFETNNTPPVAEPKLVRINPRMPALNLDDPKSLRQYALKHGLGVPEIIVPPAGCSGGT
jgi:hypothetical protein